MGVLNERAPVVGSHRISLSESGNCHGHFGVQVCVLPSARTCTKQASVSSPPKNPPSPSLIIRTMTIP